MRNKTICSYIDVGKQDHIQPYGDRIYSGSFSKERIVGFGEFISLKQRNWSIGSKEKDSQVF